MKRTTQFLRTDRAIMDALIRLLREHSFEEITVQNILEETPVTRATFYAHYHDKYEIAERMQEMFIQAFQEVPGLMSDVDRSKHPQVIKNVILRYQDITQALLKIRTDRVDIRSVLARMHKQHYLAHAGSRYSEAEAEVYAQAMTALQLSYLDESTPALDDPDYYDQVVVSVFLRILRLENDAPLGRKIYEHLPSKYRQ